MSFVKPYKGLQTVVASGTPNKVQVNTYNGDSWLISNPIYPHEVKEIKKKQLERVNSI